MSGEAGRLDVESMTDAEVIMLAQDLFLEGELMRAQAQEPW